MSKKDKKSKKIELGGKKKKIEKKTSGESNFLKREDLVRSIAKETDMDNATSEKVLNVIEKIYAKHLKKGMSVKFLGKTIKVTKTGLRCYTSPVVDYATLSLPHLKCVWGGIDFPKVNIKGAYNAAKKLFTTEDGEKISLEEGKADVDALAEKYADVEEKPAKGKKPSKKDEKPAKGKKPSKKDEDEDDEDEDDEDDDDEDDDEDDDDDDEEDDDDDDDED
jgi:hypothetical protein